MTPPVTTEALVESLRKSLAMAANDPGNVIRADGTKVGYKGDRCMGGWIADAIIAGPLAPLLAAHQQVTAERDEARKRASDFLRDIAEDADLWTEFTERMKLVEAENDRMKAERCRLDRRIGNQRRALQKSWDIVEQRVGAEAMRRLRYAASRLAKRAATAEASLATATSELARLRAEAEAKDRALTEIAADAAKGARCTFKASFKQWFARIEDIARTALAHAATAREG